MIGELFLKWMVHSDRMIDLVRSFVPGASWDVGKFTPKKYFLEVIRIESEVKNVRGVFN
jgi:hypothetical protein